MGTSDANPQWLTQVRTADLAILARLLGRSSFTLLIELRARGVPVLAEVPFPVKYKDHVLPTHSRADFVCFESVVVEVKAMNAKTAGVEEAQMINYLRASGMQHGLLFNFGRGKLESRRFILSSAGASSTAPAL